MYTDSACVSIANGGRFKPLRRNRSAPSGSRAAAAYTPSARQRGRDHASGRQASELRVLFTALCDVLASVVPRSSSARCLLRPWNSPQKICYHDLKSNRPWVTGATPHAGTHRCIGAIASGPTLRPPGWFTSKASCCAHLSSGFANGRVRAPQMQSCRAGSVPSRQSRPI